MKKKRSIVISLAGVLLVACFVWMCIPAFMRARAVSHHNQCVQNLRIIESSKEECALEIVEKKIGRTLRAHDMIVEMRKHAGLNLNTTEVQKFMRDGKTPKCPTGGEYSFGLFGEYPVCSAHGDLMKKYGGSLFFDEKNR